MGRTKAVPPSDSRLSPAFWKQMIEGSDKRRAIQNEQFERFARWHRGDLTDVVDPGTVRDKSQRWQASLDNMTFLATEASKADLFFRNPRFVVRPPFGAQHPQFSPKLSRVETTLLHHGLRSAGFRRKARRGIQDGLLAGIGVLKVTSDAEVVVDEEVLDEAKQEAQDEIAAFMQGTEMKAKDDQIHSVHVTIKENFLTMAERGEIQLPKAALKYLRQHVKIHRSMITSERPSETIRFAQPRIRRVNPLDYAYDPTADDRDDCSWHACRFLMRRADLLGNDDYSKEARLQAQTISDRWVDRNYQSRQPNSPGAYDIPDQMVMVHEVFDLVDQRRYLFTENGAVMLLEEDRRELEMIQPSGPFHTLVLIEDTFEGQGVPPPCSFEAEQAAATHIASANVAAATASQARTLFDSDAIDAIEAQKAWTSGAATMVPIARKGNPDKAFKDLFHPGPIAEIPAQNMAVLADARRGVDRRSGLGTAKMGGGESSPTATGAALGSEASSSISDDRASTVDEWSEGVARAFVRLTRRFTPKSHVVTVCGPDAIEAWPDRWGLVDVADDIGVEIIPGSSRRMNTSVDQKQLMDGIMAFESSVTLLPGPAKSMMTIEMFRRYFEDGGITGLDWNSLEQEVVMAQAMQQEMQGGMPEEEGAGGGGVPEEDQEPSEANDIEQGVQNVGGGRVPSGSSIGDRISAARSGAKDSVAQRGQ
jgi:hypothetical protein